MERKLHDWGLASEHIDEVVDELVESNFINEDRFLQSYVRGKFLSRKWGKQKIRNSLIEKRIPDDKIRKALEKLNSEGYEKTAKQLLDKKWEELAKYDDRNRRSKAYYSMLNKGYEAPLVIRLLDELK